jgi:hypothetical protein
MMQDERLPTLALKYKPVGKRTRGRPRRLVLGREVRNTGLRNLVNISRRRGRRIMYVASTDSH